MGELPRAALSDRTDAMLGAAPTGPRANRAVTVQPEQNPDCCCAVVSAGPPGPPLTSRTRVPLLRLSNKIAVLLALVAAIAAPTSAAAATNGHRAFSPIWGVQVSPANSGLDASAIRSLRATGVNALV